MYIYIPLDLWHPEPQERHQRHPQPVQREIQGVLRFDDGDGEKNIITSIVSISKKKTLHVQHTFLYISLPSLHNNDMKMTNFPFLGGCKKATTKFSSLSEPGYIVLENSTPGWFAYIWPKYIVCSEDWNNTKSLLKPHFCCCCQPPPLSESCGKFPFTRASFDEMMWHWFHVTLNLDTILL